MYAYFTPNKYTVTFDANTGNTPNPTSKTVTYDSTYGTLATVAKTGYTFNGWFTEKTNGEKITDTTKVSITENQTLYAHWTINTYKVTINANSNGTVSKTSMNIVFGSSGTFTVTPKSGNYLESISCTNGYKTSGYTTTISSTGTQTVTISNNNQPKDSVCTVKFNIVCPYTNGQSWDYNYTGGVQSFQAKCDGIYKLEVWGGSGGDLSRTVNGVRVHYGTGGYSIGYAKLKKGQYIYIVVGGMGQEVYGYHVLAKGGYNGGGHGYGEDLDTRKDEQNVSRGGGGATHIATANRGELYNYASYKSEVLIVAGGGGGATVWGDYWGSGNGGGLNGGNTPTALGGSQTIGGNGYDKPGTTIGEKPTMGGAAGFGHGGSHTFTNDSHCGGGGGWYGGGQSIHTYGAGGGSGYIGGVPSFSYSGKTYAPSTSAGNSTSNVGNGKSKITFMTVYSQ